MYLGNFDVDIAKFIIFATNGNVIGAGAQVAETCCCCIIVTAIPGVINSSVRNHGRKNGCVIAIIIQSNEGVKIAATGRYKNIHVGKKVDGEPLQLSGNESFSNLCRIVGEAVIYCVETSAYNFHTNCIRRGGFCPVGHNLGNVVAPVAIMDYVKHLCFRGAFEQPDKFVSGNSVIEHTINIEGRYVSSAIFINGNVAIKAGRLTGKAVTREIIPGNLRAGNGTSGNRY